MNLGAPARYRELKEKQEEKGSKDIAPMVAYQNMADVLNAHSGGKLSRMDVPNDQLTAYHLGYRWAYGLGPKEYTFTEKSVLGQQMLRADYVQDQINEAVKKAHATGTTSTVEPAGYDLGKESRMQQAAFIPRFMWDVGVGTMVPNDTPGVNPAKAFQGSIGGRVQATPVKMPQDSSYQAYNVTIDLSDTMRAVSAGHYPPALGGYASQNQIPDTSTQPRVPSEAGQNPPLKDKSAFATDNPFGADGPGGNVKVRYVLRKLVVTPKQ